MKWQLKPLIGAAILCAPCSAWAESWIVYGEDGSPNRSAMVVDAGSIIDRGKNLFDASASIVFESAQQPDRVTLNYRVDCKRKTLAASGITNQWRTKPPELIGSGSLPDHKPADFSEEQVLAFVCARSTERLKGSFIPIGNVGASPSDYIWKALWSDGKRPGTPPPRKLTKAEEAEVARLNAELDKNMERARATVDRGMAVAQGALRSSRGVDGGKARELDAWVGESEQAFAAKWGAPASFTDDGNGFRTLHYHWAQAYTQDIFQNGVKIGENAQDEHWCDATILVRNGRISDYGLNGSSCGEFFR